MVHAFLRTVKTICAAFGIAVAVLLGIGLMMDVRAIDQTRGGYEPPYTDYTGTPINWSALDQTATGMAYRGRVVNLLINCESGMMHFEVFGIQIPWRELSPRALVIHEPRKACEERGFRPQF